MSRRNILIGGVLLLALLVLLAAAVVIGIRIGSGSLGGGPAQPTDQGDKPKPEAKSKPDTKTNPELAVGDTATVASGDEVTVYSYTSSLTPANQFTKPKPGNEFSAIEVQACAGDNETTINPANFSLQMPNDSRLQTAFATAIEPNLPLSNLASGDCVRGYVTFETPQGESP